MAISENKMQIVIDNYFKSECNINTSIRSAFEKGFRIGVKKASSAQPERKSGHWIKLYTGVCKCSECGDWWKNDDIEVFNFCPNCGADMRGEDHETD